MKEVYAKLQSKGLIGRGVVKKEAIAKLTKKRIIETANQIASTCVPVFPKKAQSFLAHAASLELTGSSGCCTAMPCRKAKLDQLARFAVIYSDVVYIHNFIADICRCEKAETDWLQRRFYDDLSLFLRIRPLVEKGLFIMLTPENHSCPTCFLHRFKINPDMEKRIKKSVKSLGREYLLNTSIIVRWDGIKYGFGCTGPSPYYEHGPKWFVRDSIPESMCSMPRLVKRLHDTRKIMISETLKKKLPCHKVLAEGVAMNICFELATSRVLNTSFVTNNPIHISFLKMLTNDTVIEQRNKIAFKHLTTEVPFLGDVTNKNILKIRDREYESFMLFRDAMNEAIEEFRSTTNIRAKGAKCLYGDIIRPKLAILDHTVKTAKKDLVSKAMHAAMATVAALSFGLYTGFLNAQIAPIAAALGLPKIASDIEKFLAIGNAENVIKNDDMYFLWKVKDRANKKS